MKEMVYLASSRKRPIFFEEKNNITVLIILHSITCIYLYVYLTKLK